MQRKMRMRGWQLCPSVTGVVSILFFVFLVVVPARSDQHFRAKVVKIVDGDSLVIRYKEKSIGVRLWGIDTPEWRQPFSKLAKKYTATLVGNTVVTIEEKDWDSYGRLVAVVTTEDNKLLNEELVKAGLAWVHIYYCKEAICDKWYAYESQARERQIGLWYDKDPVPPWVWKRKKK